MIWTRAWQLSTCRLRFKVKKPNFHLDNIIFEFFPTTDSSFLFQFDMCREVIVRSLFFKFCILIILVLKSRTDLPELWSNTSKKPHQPKFSPKQIIEPRRTFTARDFENFPMFSSRRKPNPIIIVTEAD